jgi:ABC-type multidrug transport system fused ATPase/permease subunit
MSLFALTKVWYDYEVALWAESTEQQDRFVYFMSYLFILAVLNSFFVFLRVVTISTFSWHASRRLHDRMVERVMNAPINLYFDRTPIGRILNRFSKDLQAADA